MHKANVIEYLLFYLCGFCGIAIAFILSMICLPESPILMTVYCILGALLGAGASQAIWHAINRKKTNT